jgi:hypothetical protein
MLSEVGIMSLDGPVLVIALFAVALKLYLWFSEKDVVRGDVEPDRNDMLQLDEGVVATSLRPRSKGDRYV